MKLVPLNLSNCKVLVPKMSYLGIFRLEFEKHIVIFEISVLEFVLLQKFGAKLKILNLGPKIRGFGTFGLEFENFVKK